MKSTHFSSKAYGTRDSKETTLNGRLQLDMLQVMQRDYKLRSYSLNSVSSHFLSQLSCSILMLARAHFRCRRAKGRCAPLNHHRAPQQWPRDTTSSCHLLYQSKSVQDGCFWKSMLNVCWFRMHFCLSVSWTSL